MTRVLPLSDYLEGVDSPDYAAYVLYLLCTDIVDRWKERRALGVADGVVIIQAAEASRHVVTRFEFPHKIQGTPDIGDFQRLLADALQMVGCVEGLHHFHLLATDPGMNIYKARRILQGLC